MALPETTEKIGDFLDRRLREVGRSSQIVIAMDSRGILRAEMPGENGARRKVDLSPNFAKKNPELIRLLRADQDRIAAQAKQISELKTAEQIKRNVDSDAERTARQTQYNEQAHKRMAWLNSLSAAQRALEEAKIDAKLQKMADESNRRAHGIYYYTVKNHTLMLAQRVITDPARRPKRLAAKVGKAVASREITAAAAKIDVDLL